MHDPGAALRSQGAGVDFKAEAERLLSDKDPKIDFDTAVRQWSNGRLTPRPGYYAGRGPMICDLNSEILEDLWKGIQKNVGDEAARNFVLMVENLKDMSASAFLVSFQHYWHNKWRWDDRQQQPGDGVALSGHGEALYTEGMFAVLSALSDKRDTHTRDWQSDEIKRSFLMRHGTRRFECKARYDGYHPDFR
jgi:hypothetical protein